MYTEDKARFKRRILHAPNAIQTMHNEEAYLIIYCLNCIRCMQNSTFETGLIDEFNVVRQQPEIARNQGCQITAFLEPNLQQCSLFSFVFAFCFLCLLEDAKDDLAPKMQ